jgi:crotonobetaine/carnitine-CoA ligase
MIIPRESALASSVGGLLRMQAEAQPDATLVTIPGGESHTYEQLHLSSNSVARGLASLGVKSDDHVAIMLPNGMPFLTTWFAVAKLGATIVPLNPVYRGATLEYLLEHSEVEVIVVDAASGDTVSRLASRLTRLRHVVVVEGSVDVPWPSTDLQEIERHDPGELPDAVSPDTVLAILYTSGTTGHPKGGVNSHRCAVHWALNYAANMQVAPDDTNFLFTPLHHAMSSLLGVVPALLTGSRVAVADGFHASTFWQDCRSLDATLFNFAGGVLSFLWKQPERADDADNPVRRALGVPIPDGLHGPFEGRFGVTLLPPFGTSESGVVCYSTPGQVRHGSSGHPIPEHEVAIVGDDGERLPAGERGEIVMRPRHPDSMMRGYYKQPDLTVKVFRDLWYHTGDIGWMDADGYLFFVDRKKDAIRRRGENISSFEVERVANTHPAVLESAAVGIPSPHGEEEVKLAVVPLEGAVIEVEELWAFLDEELTPFMVPRYLEVRGSLPRTQTERVQKFVIREEGVHPGVVDREVLRKVSR